MIQMQSRVVGATIPGEEITFKDSGVVIDPSAGYTWTVECSTEAARTAILWTKSTGFNPSATKLTIAWLPADLGALPSGIYILEVIGTHAAGVRKALLRVVIDQQNG